MLYGLTRSYLPPDRGSTPIYPGRYSIYLQMKDERLSRSEAMPAIPGVSWLSQPSASINLPTNLLSSIQSNNQPTNLPLNQSPNQSATQTIFHICQSANLTIKCQLV